MRLRRVYSYGYSKDRRPDEKQMIVADRGMVSKETVEELEGLGVGYIFGIKMRKEKEARGEVLSRAGKYRDVKDNLKVKEEDTLYV